MEYLVIGIGGFLGANARYLVAGWAAERFGVAFPWGCCSVLSWEVSSSPCPTIHRRQGNSTFFSLSIAGE